MTRKSDFACGVIVVSCLFTLIACEDHRALGTSFEATPTAPKSTIPETSLALLNSSANAVRAKMNPQLRAKLDQIRSTPQHKEMIDRLFRINARGSLAVAFTGDVLPKDVIGYVYLGQVGDPSRYALFSSANFDDAIYDQVRGVAFSYEMAHEADRSPVKIVVHADNLVEIESEALGQSVKLQRITGHTSDPKRVSAALLARAATVAPEVVGTHRQVRVLRPDTYAQ